MLIEHPHLSISAYLECISCCTQVSINRCMRLWCERPIHTASVSLTLRYQYGVVIFHFQLQSAWRDLYIYMYTCCLLHMCGSCGHLFHVSCLGVDIREARHFNHSCIVCHKTSAPPPSRGRASTMMVSHSSLHLLPCSLSLSLSILLLPQGQHRGKSFSAKRIVSLSDIPSSSEFGCQ